MLFSVLSGCETTYARFVRQCTTNAKYINLNIPDLNEVLSLPIESACNEVEPLN